MGSDKDDGRGIKPYLRKIGLTLEQHLERKAHPRSPFSINPRKLRHLLAVTRDASGMAGLIYTESSFFKSERITKPNPGSTSKWRSDRIMVEIPLYVSDELVKMTDFTADYSSLPKDLTDIL